MTTNVLELLERSAELYPERVMVSDESTQLSFSEFKSRAMAVGSSLCRLTGGARNSPVLVLVGRGVSSLVCMLGAVYSGNFYVPVDAASPRERLCAIIDTLCPAAVLFPEKSALPRELFEGIACLEYSDCREAADEKALAAIRCQMIDLDPLYCIFTSGSTGVPKGVVITHRGVLDLSDWLCHTFGFSTATVMGNQTPFYFDASVKDIYICLRAAATLHILPKKLFSFPVMLTEYLNSRRINTILWAASAITLTANSGILEKKPPLYLEKVFFAGEVLGAKQLGAWTRALPGASFTNIYGPTEITVDCSYYTVDREFSDDEPIPMGKACRNKALLLLTPQDTPAQPGQVGEICVRGTGLALGYYNRPEQTRQVFCQNPLNPHYTDLIYRTGDLARYNERGELIFVSRQDDQIKRGGNRIELGEIENALTAMDGVEAGVCVYDHERQEIIFVYSGRKLESAEVFSFLRSRLPKYMFPNRLEQMERLPYTPNGKLDRVRLKKEFANGSGS